MIEPTDELLNAIREQHWREEGCQFGKDSYAAAYRIIAAHVLAALRPASAVPGLKTTEEDRKAVLTLAPGSGPRVLDDFDTLSARLAAAERKLAEARESIAEMLDAMADEEDALVITGPAADIQTHREREYAFKDAAARIRTRSKNAR